MRLTLAACTAILTSPAYASAISIGIGGTPFDVEADFAALQNGDSLTAYTEDGIVVRSQGTAARIGDPIDPFNGASAAMGGFYSPSSQGAVEIELASGDNFDSLSFHFGRFEPQMVTLTRVIVDVFDDGVLQISGDIFLFRGEFGRVLGNGDPLDLVRLTFVPVVDFDPPHIFAIDNVRIDLSDTSPVPLPAAFVPFLATCAAFRFRRRMLPATS